MKICPSLTGIMRHTIFLYVLFVVEWETRWCASVPLRIVDLTHVVDSTTNHGPLPGFEINETYLGIPNSDFRAKVEVFSYTTHGGTHIDTPCHIIPNGLTLDDIPLYRLMAPAAVVDIRDKVAVTSNYELQIDDLQQWENTTGHHLNEVILLVSSGWSKKWSNGTEYFGNPTGDMTKMHFPGMSPLAASWLVANRNVYGVGVEAPSVHHDLSKNIRIHQILLSKNIYSLEAVDSMEELPIFGANLYVMPMKIGRTCGSPSRVVATFPDVIYGL